MPDGGAGKVARMLTGVSRPGWLVLLLVVVALGLAYVLALRRRRRDTLTFTALEHLDRIAPDLRQSARHLPTAGLLVALVLLTVGLAGPTAHAEVPRNRATVVLVLDVSLSMTATDVRPSRLAAAQAAAVEFTAGLPPGIQLGLVSFAGSAAVLVSPTTDRSAVERAISALTPFESTATGEAIFTALRSILDHHRSLGGDPADPPPARIVLLSDGKQNVPDGPDAESLSRGSFTAAAAAAAARIPVSSIAFGTDHGVVDIDGEPVAVPADEPAMREIARISEGSTYTATSGDELRQVYATLGQQIGYELREVEVSGPWFAAGTLLTMTGLGLAVASGRRIP